jgi:DNA-binding NarL/FixJ family response regulator
MSSAAVPILIADGDPVERVRLAELVARIGNPVAAATGPEALEVTARLHPSVVLLDVDLPEIGGYEVCRELRDQYGHEIAVIFLSAERTTSGDTVAGLLLGADDYIVKPFEPDELRARVRAVLRRVTRTGSAPAGAPTETSLTTREREVLGLLASGLSQSEIAARLFISPKTVSGHIQRVLAKLGVHSRAQAVALAYEQGLAEVQAHGGAMLRVEDPQGAASGLAPSGLDPLEGRVLEHQPPLGAVLREAHGHDPAGLDAEDDALAERPVADAIPGG